MGARVGVYVCRREIDFNPILHRNPPFPLHSKRKGKSIWFDTVAF